MDGQVAGHYRVLEKLGEGGMGVVYKARDTRLGRIVAIKLLAPDRVSDPIRKQRFFQEARTASALNHPNIVTVYDIASEGQSDFLVMEFVPGKTLEEIVRRKPLGYREAIDYGLQIADALSAAHASGIVHRDIKPSNVMVTEEGRVKVLDFGLAKLAEQGPVGQEEPTRTLQQRTEEGLVVGSVPYMSPEQAEGRAVDGRTDVFSLGALLYEMCTGRRAFSAETPAATLAAVITKDPPPIEQFAPDTPVELQRAILRCLRKDPNRRFQSMLDLKLTLEELKSEGDSLTVSRLHAASPPKAASRLTIAAAAALFVLLAGGGWLWWRSGHGLTRPPLSLEQLTFDGGLTTDPAIAPDGKLIAYASDRAGEGNLDIWVQYRGGEPIRITHDPEDEDQPAFSPDGTQIAFRSTRDGGGIYIVSSLGGGEPRRIASGGGRPRFSPDGTEILFDNPSPTVRRAYTVNIVTPGAQRNQLAPEFSYVQMPVWSPDGRNILFAGLREAGTQPGLWVIPRNGGAAERVLLDLASLPSEIRQVSLDAWLSGDRVLGEFALRGRTNLWQARLRRGPWRLDRIEQVTSGTGLATKPSVAADGTMVVSNEETDLDLWSLPFDAVQGKVTGDPQRLTHDAAREAYPSISADGTKLTYSADQGSGSHIWIMDLPARSKRALTASREFDIRPVISADGTQVAYASGNPMGSSSFYRIPAAGGSAQKVGEKGVIIWDWMPDGKGLLVMGTARPIGVDRIDLAANRTSSFLKRTHNVFQAHISHDGHWAIAQEADVGVVITPFDPSRPLGANWQPLGLKGVDLVRWSPDDNAIYFISSRDSFRCIWGQHLDPLSKQLRGEPFPMAHFHQAGRSLAVLDSGEIGLAVARDKIVIAEAEKTANLWTTKLEP